jgi:hypothetical protein
MESNVWTFREPVSSTLAGFEVEATDGSIGKVDDASLEPEAGFIVVDTGPWILGRKVILPAFTIVRIDEDEGIVYVDRSKEEIKSAPEYDPSGYAQQEYRAAIGGYYSAFYD